MCPLVFAILKISKEYNKVFDNSKILWARGTARMNRHCYEKLLYITGKQSVLIHRKAEDDQNTMQAIVRTNNLRAWELVEITILPACIHSIFIHTHSMASSTLSTRNKNEKIHFDSCQRYNLAESQTGKEIIINSKWW